MSMQMSPNKKASINETELYRALDIVSTKYLKEERVFPLLIFDRCKTEDALDRAGVLHNEAITSIRFAQYQRAAWYILALQKLCISVFSENHSVVAKTALSKVIVN